MGDLQGYMKTIYSADGEDGIIEEIMRRLCVPKGWFVEFGARDGISLSNTWRLAELGWHGVYIECDPQWFPKLKENCASNPRLRCVNAKVDNKDNVLDKVLYPYAVPTDFDLLSIDIDGHDYWVWKACQMTPKVVVIEYNSHFEPTESKSIPDDPNYRYSCNQHYGASARALYNLGKEKGYTLVAYNNLLNLFFVRNDLASPFEEFDVMRIPKAVHKDPSPFKMIDV